MNRMKPDFYVRSPNVVKGFKHLHMDLEVPTLFSLQDMGPHSDCVHLLKEFPLKPQEWVFFIVHSFLDAYLEAGAPREQLICDYLPPRNGVFDLEAYTVEPRYEVGYVKTMGKSLKLTEMLQEAHAADPQRLESIEQRFLQQIQQEGPMDFMSCASQGKTRHEQQEMLNFYHQQHSLSVLESLAAAGFSLGITGANWELHPHLSAHALGHAESREDYQMRFLDNKINLSINPWAQHHPRIFEGGICGAFFLVYHVDTEHSVCHLPPELVPGEHFDYFYSLSDLNEKCRYYLERPGLRKEIGANLKGVIEEKYSYRPFCEKLLQRFSRGK